LPARRRERSSAAEGSRHRPESARSCQAARRSSAHFRPAPERARHSLERLGVEVRLLRRDDRRSRRRQWSEADLCANGPGRWRGRVAARQAARRADGSRRRCSRSRH
jgi:hypothetical protein